MTTTTSPGSRDKISDSNAGRFRPWPMVVTRPLSVVMPPPRGVFPYLATDAGAGGDLRLGRDPVPVRAARAHRRVAAGRPSHRPRSRGGAGLDPVRRGATVLGPDHDHAGER